MGTRWRWVRHPLALMGLALVLGLALRTYHYARNPSMWHDEAALVINLLERQPLDIWGPLRHHEAAPPLFLIAEIVVVQTLGDGTYALRLLPFLASCTSLLLLALLANRLLEPGPAVWAVLLFACSNHLLWHSCEAKPYSMDVFSATVLWTIYCLFPQRWLAGQVMVLVLLAPVVIWLSFPGCFLYGGLLVALLPRIWRRRQVGHWCAYGVLVVVVAVAFLALVFGPIRAQRCPEMTSCWIRLFVPWDEPWRIPAWLVFSTLEVGRYGFDPLGQCLMPLAFLGGLYWWRRWRRELVAALVIPIVLALVASGLHAYPFGGARVMVYAAPALALLIAAGVPVAWEWLRVRPRWRPGLAILIALLLAPVAESAYRVVQPWPRPECDRAAAYVLAQRQPGDAVAANHWEYEYYFRCLGADFQPVDQQRDSLERLWVVLTGMTPETEARWREEVTSNAWTLARQQAFFQTSVYLLCRGTPSVD